MKKKLFSIIMCVLMIMCFMPTAAFADGGMNQTNNSVVSVTTSDGVKTYYDTLPAAISALTGGETMTLLKDTTVRLNDESDGGYDGTGADSSLWSYVPNVTFDLNNKTLTTVSNHGGSYNVLNVFATGWTIKDGAIIAKHADGTADSYAVGVTGGENKGDSEVLFDNVDLSGGVAAYGYVTVTMKDTSMGKTQVAATNYYCVYSEAADIIIDGGEYTSNGTMPIFYTTSSYGESITVKDGEFTGTILGGGGTVSITGGIFTANPTAYVDTEKGFSASQNEDDKWVVSEPVAEVNGTKFGTLNAAIEAAQDGDIVNILSDCNIEPIEIGYSEGETEAWTKGGITIDGKGHTVTGWSTTSGSEYSGFYAIDVYNKVSFKNIKFKNFGTEDTGTLNGAAVIYGGSGCNITLTNCSFEKFNREAIYFGGFGGGNLTVIDCYFDCTPTDEKFSIQKAILIAPGTAESKVTIKNCQIKHATSTDKDWTAGGIEIFSGDVTIEDSTITNCDEGISISREYYSSDNVDIKVSMEDVTVSAKNEAVCIKCYKGGETEAHVTIKSGNYTGEIGIWPAIMNEGDEDPTEADLNKCTLKVTGGNFDTNPRDYIDTNSIVMRSGSEGSYTYTVVTKSNLGAGTYLSDPTDYLASRCYVGNTGEGTWTVYRYSSSGSSSTTTTDNVINTTETTKSDSGETTTVPETKATVKAETKTADDGTKTTTSTVDTTTASKIVEKAVENKSEEVIVNAGITAVAETAAGTTTEVAIPAETVSQIAEKTTAAVTIETEAAEVTLDEKAVEAVAEQAGETGGVKLVVETRAQDENKVEVELKIETSNGVVSDFKGGNVTVTVKLNSALATKPVMCVYIDDNGVYHKVAGQKNADGTYTFTTGHFSTYAIMSVEDVDAAIAKQEDSAKNLVSKLSLKARSTKTSKGNIKVNLTVDDEGIQAIKDLGYTVKYKFYRSTKKSSSYKAMLEKAGKTYTNTTGKKGTRYYYKARVMVYDSEGTLIAKTALTQCKYAVRIK